MMGILGDKLYEDFVNYLIKRGGGSERVRGRKSKHPEYL